MTQAPALTNDIERLVCSYSWPCVEALNVMWCESGGKPNAIGGGSNYGLFQLNQIWASRWPDFWESWPVPSWNVERAFTLYSESGWRPWACAPW
jgi:hypothetical protein